MSRCVGGLLWLYCDVHEFINGPTLIFYLITAFIFKDQIFFFLIEWVAVFCFCFFTLRNNALLFESTNAKRQSPVLTVQSNMF